MFYFMSTSPADAKAKTNAMAAGYALNSIYRSCFGSSRCKPWHLFSTLAMGKFCSVSNRWTTPADHWLQRGPSVVHKDGWTQAPDPPPLQYTTTHPHLSAHVWAHWRRSAYAAWPLSLRGEEGAMRGTRRGENGDGGGEVLGTVRSDSGADTGGGWGKGSTRYSDISPHVVSQTTLAVTSKWGGVRQVGPSWQVDK